MNLSFNSVLEEIEKSEAFKNFKKTNPSAYLCAGFFVLDYENNLNQKQLDYSLENGSIFTFILDKEITIKQAETMEGNKKLKQLKKGIKVDLDKIEEILAEKTKGKKILKIIAVLQENEGRQIWNINSVLQGMGILKSYIDSFTGEIIKFEEKSMFDFIKKIK